ncbi:MAG: peptidylprolyl isomerase, partial [Flavobacteriales bacterium]
MKWTTLVFLTLLMACGNGETSEPESAKELEMEVEEPEVKKEKPIVNEGFPRLNDQNVEEFLRAYGEENPETKIKITSEYGDIEIELFEDTPLHRANFIYLINRGYYSPTELVRVIKGFMIQGGNSEEIGPASDRMLMGSYCIPEEMSMRHVHHRGALAMSRIYEDNPEKCSSGYDFYIVQGSKYKGVHIFKAEQE